MKTACIYAILRFQPYVETGEFANIGVALCCPDLRYFGYKLMTKKYGRVTQFFEGLESEIYLEAVRSAGAQLKEFRSVLKTGPLDGRRHLDGRLARELFSELVKPRESLLRFGETVAAITDDPEQLLAELFDFYVGRNFISREYREKVLDRAVRGILNGDRLTPYFFPMPVGDDSFHVTVPFVYAKGDEPKIAIKPIALNQADPSKIYDHGGHWVDRVARLKRLGRLPETFLFVADSAAVDDEQNALPRELGEMFSTDRFQRVRAAQVITIELRAAGAKVVPLRDDSEILTVARAAKTFSTGM